jgi:hypothetical protein
MNIQNLLLHTHINSRQNSYLLNRCNKSELLLFFFMARFVAKKLENFTFEKILPDKMYVWEKVDVW